MENFDKTFADVSNTSALSGPIRNSYWTRRRRSKQILSSWKSNQESPLENCIMTDPIPLPFCSTSSQTAQSSYSFDRVEQSAVKLSASETELQNEYSALNEFGFSDDEIASGSESDDYDGTFPDSWDSDTSDSAEIGIGEKLAGWVSEFGVESVVVDKLLKILHCIPVLSHLPLTCRTLLQTGKCSDAVVAMPGGEYMHYGILKGLMSLKQHLLRLRQQNIQYQVNIDGLPLYKSSSRQLWPILGKVVGIKSDPFIIGVYCGSTKPKNVGEYLKAFIEEAKTLAEDGFEIDGCKLKASIACFICDAPARSFLKQVRGHTGYYGCERCVQKGFYTERRMTYPMIDAEKRNDAVFSVMGYKDHQFDLSPLHELKVGLVSGFILDSMHLVHLGLCRRLLHMWTKGPRSTKLSYVQVDIISKKLLSLRTHVPCEFARKPRSLHEVERWKATEFRQFLLYTGIVVLEPELDVTLYQNFLCLSVAIYMLSNKKLLNHYVNYAEELIAYFIQQSMDLYGPSFAVYNVHSLLHIVDDARKYGSLECISSFPFENFLGQLKKSIRKPQFVLQQISNRLSEGYFHSPNNELAFPVLKKEHSSGPLVVGMMNLKQYKEVYVAGFALKIKSGDNCIGYSTNNEHIGLIENIFSERPRIYLLMKRFKKREAAFKEPLLSSDIDIHILSNISDSYDVCELHDVKRKYVLLPLKAADKWMGIPLLHVDDA